MNDVLWYINMEYGSSNNNEYIHFWNDTNFLNNTLNGFIGSYYLGGNNVPDTANAVVQLIKSKYPNEI